MKRILLIVLLAACKERGDGGPSSAPAVTEVPKRTEAPRPDAAPSPRIVRVSGGTVFGRDESCPPSKPEPHYVRTSVESFGIDYATVSCAEWQACVDAGACPQYEPEEPPVKPSHCRHNVAFVYFAEAEGYCRWRGGRLPSWAEWHRALRADRRDAQVPDADCRRPVRRGRFSAEECELVSSEGVSFVLRNHNEWEWTRDVHCIDHPVSVNVSATALGLSVLAPRAELRCTYE